MKKQRQCRPTHQDEGGERGSRKQNRWDVLVEKNKQKQNYLKLYRVLKKVLLFSTKRQKKRGF